METDRPTGAPTDVWGSDPETPLRIAVADRPAGARHRPGFVPGDIIGVVAGLLLLGFFALQMQQAYQVLFGDGLGEFTIRAVDLWFNSAVLFVVLGVLPWLWVLTTRQGGWGGMLDYFGLRHPGRPMLQGLGLGFAMLAVLLLVGVILEATGAGQDNAAIGPLQAIMTLPLAIAVSTSAAVGEEVLFRGIVQKHIGLWAQAVVFGLLHAYQGTFGIVVTFLIAVLFGYTMKKRHALWIPIVAHFTFDFIQLGLLIVAREAA